MVLRAQGNTACAEAGDARLPDTTYRGATMNDVESVTQDNTAGPSAMRYDSYLFIHKALRALMADTLVRLGSMDPSDDSGTHAVLEQVRQAIALGQAHLHKEEEFVHPAMEARAPGSTRRASADHVSHSAAFEKILSACHEVESSQGAVRAARALCLYRRFALLMAEDLVHMNAEETENNAVLWATYTDQEIHALTARLVASIPADTLSRYLSWMVTANAPRDRVAILSGIRERMPKSAFSRLLEAVMPGLRDTERSRLVAELA